MAPDPGQVMVVTHSALFTTEDGGLTAVQANTAIVLIGVDWHNKFGRGVFIVGDGKVASRSLDKEGNFSCLALLV